MQKKFKKLVSLTAVATLSMLASMTAFAGEWKSNDKGWWYEENGSYPTNGWRNIDGKQYMFDKEGYVMSGWVTDKSKYFYLNPNHDGSFGAMQTGWVFDGADWYYLEPKTGEMVTGWRNIDGKNYYLDSNNGGRMLKAGWHNLGLDWYYMNADGSAVTGWFNGDGTGQWFYMDEMGRMRSGWQNVGGYWYYLNPNHDGTYGAMKTGWLELGDGWYYCEPGSGKMVTGDRVIDGKNYSFGSSGIWLSNVYENGTYYGEQKPGTVKTDRNGKTTVSDSKTKVYSIKYLDEDKKESKPASSVRREINDYIEELPSRFITGFYENGGKITYYTDFDTVGTRKYKDEDGETEEYDVVYQVKSSKSIEFCGEPVNVLLGFGRFIDEYMYKNSNTYKKVAAPSQVGEFDEIYDTELANIDNVDDVEFDYDTSYMRQDDYFDLCYAMYRSGSKSFKENCPESYKYVKSIESKCINLLDD